MLLIMAKIVGLFIILGATSYKHELLCLPPLLCLLLVPRLIGGVTRLVLSAGCNLTYVYSSCCRANKQILLRCLEKNCDS